MSSSNSRPVKTVLDVCAKSGVGSSEVNCSAADNGMLLTKIAIAPDKRREWSFGGGTLGNGVPIVNRAVPIADEETKAKSVPIVTK